MERYVKWRDQSFQTSREPERWVPKAILEVIEGSKGYPQQICLSNEDSEKVKRGEIVYSPHKQAKAAAYEMVKRHVWNKWALPEEKIQEYRSNPG